MQIFLFKTNFTKRQRFVFLTFIITAGLVTTQLVSQVELHMPMAGALFIFAGVLGFFGFYKEVSDLRRFTSLILISFYTGAIALFYFLLPVRWLTRLPTAVLFSVGFYAILLTENIYNIATEKSIQLLRAARSIGLLMTLITIFLLFDTLLSFRLAPWLNFILLTGMTAPLNYQCLWSMKLDKRLNSNIVFNSFLLSLMLGEVGLGLSFWPVNMTMEALFLTAFFYLLTVLVQQQMIERLFAKTIRELIIVAGIVFILLVFTSSWGG